MKKPQPRKRRRQIWHAKNAFRRFKKGVKRRATKDQGVFEGSLPKVRKAVTIQKKLEVIDYYNEILAEKTAAMETLKEACPRGVTKATKQKLRQDKIAARLKIKRNVQKLCEQKFDFVKGSRVRLWRKSAIREGWAELPQTLKARLTCATNEWRKRFDVPAKGRKSGGMIPMDLQRELDLLMVEMASGSSDVAERREIVAVEDVAAKLFQLPPGSLT